MLDLLISEIQDVYSRENFRRISEENLGNPLASGKFKALELTFPQAVANLKVPHGLSFLPKDIIITSRTGAGQLTVNYDKTDLTNLDLTTDGACVVRLLLGAL